MAGDPEGPPPKSTVYDYFELWTWDRTLDRIKAWRDIWGCGQGVATVDRVQDAAAFIAQLQAEYQTARRALSLPGDVAPASSDLTMAGA